MGSRKSVAYKNNFELISAVFETTRLIFFSVKKRKTMIIRQILDFLNEKIGLSSKLVLKDINLGFSQNKNQWLNGII